MGRDARVSVGRRCEIQAMSIEQSLLCHFRKCPRSAKRCIATLAIFVSSLIVSATAQTIPTLAELPDSIATSYPDLAAHRKALLQGRAALHARVSTLNAHCAAIEEG